MRQCYPLLLYLVLLWSGTAQRAGAQASLHPGYVVQANGDTTHGFLPDRGTQINARECRFAADAGAVTAAFAPGEVRGYGFVAGKRYETLTAAVSPDSVARPRFFECMVRGEASLYVTQDASFASRYYLVLANSTPVELINHLSLVKQAGTMVRQGDRQYQKVLAQAFRKCLAMQASLNQVTLNAGSLADAVRRYNRCVDSPMTIGGTRLPNKLTVSVLGGAQSSRLGIVGQVSPLAVNYSLRSNVGPVLGIALQYESPSISRRFSVLLEGYYESQKYESDYTETRVSFPAQQQVRVATSYVHIPVLVRFASRYGKVRPFAEAGLVLALPISINQEFRSRFTNFGSREFTAWAPIADNKPAAYDYGFVGGLGVQLGKPAARKVTLRLRAEWSEGFGANSNNVATKMLREYFLVSYNLTK